MAAYRWDGSQWVDLTRRRRRVSGGWAPMSGWRWDGIEWIPLWMVTVGAVDVPVLFLNLDESVENIQSLFFNLTQDPQQQ